MLGTFKYYHQIKHLSPANVFAIVNGHAVEVANQKRLYAKDKACSQCKEVAQTEGKEVRSWPKPDPAPQAWRCECPSEAQPPHYDPYKIKVPEIMVPPLPPSNAKELSCEDGKFWNADVNLGIARPPSNIQDLFQDSPILHPDYWKDKPARKILQATLVPEANKSLGYHGKSKFMYAFHEPWKPIDRVTLLEEADKKDTEIEDLRKVDSDFV